MYGFLPKRAESLGLLFATIAILFSRSNIERQILQSPQQKGFYKPQSQTFTKNTQSSVNAQRRALPQVATAARAPKSISKTTMEPKTKAEPKSSGMANESSGNGWYYSWQTKFESPIPGDSIFTTFLQAESPYSSRLGSLEIRSELPVHLLWRQPGALSAYPPELAELRWARFPQNLLHAMYRSKLYLRWAIPGKKASKSDHLGSYLQIGSIRARAQSPWQFLNRSTPFPTSPKPQRISTAIPSGLLPGQYFANTEYESEKGIGQNIGLSLDSPNLQGFLLHQRNLRSESLQSGLALQLEKRSPQTPNSRSFAQNTENLYRIRFACLFSQNLSKAPLQSGWYLPHIQQPQNSGLYRSKQRWAELLRYDRAVKQFWLQALWRQADSQKRKIELRTEQSSSVSPLDYWGLHQRYHLLLELPLYARKSAPSRIKKLVLGNYLFAGYTDANWVDAQRRLAGSSRAQFYRRRLAVQNRMSWRFSQTLAGGGAQNHILRAVAGAKIARFLEPKMLGYVDFGLEYYWLRTRKETTRPERTWYIMSKADFAQKPPSSRQKPPVMPVLWEQILVLGVGWKQNPPNRVPQKPDRPKTSARLGWKLNIQGRQSDLIFGTGTKRLEGSLNLFVQFWRYGWYVRRTSSLRWWKLLELQCRFGTKLSWFAGRAKAGFWGQLRGRVQLAKNWSFELVLKLESVQKADGFFESPSIRLVLRHEFAGAAGAAENDAPELTEPIEAFEDAFRETAPM